MFKLVGGMMDFKWLSLYSMEAITPYVNDEVWSKIRSDVKHRVKVELLYDVLRTSILACLR
jgi:hypothetical protein